MKTSNINVSRFVLGLFLTAAAGATDAISFTRLGAIYASFMSGNTVQIGIHAIERQYVVLAGLLALVGLFMLGSFVGALIMDKARSWHLSLILILELGAFSLALALESAYTVPSLSTTAPLSFAMGAQNHLVVLARGANPATTFVTGTAFRFADAVAQRILGRDPAGAWKLHLVVWLSFAGGAAMGTLMHVHLEGYALVPICTLFAVLACAALAARLFPSRASPSVA